MNTPSLEPVILERLQHFAQRRRRLILWRGVCGGLALWFGALMLVALLDRFIVLSDGLRLALSLVGYGATAALVWWMCGRHLLRLPDLPQLARLVELAEPKLHEDLIAAVELAADAPAARWDSAAFRAALQRTVAQRLGTLQVEALLTEKLIAGWLYAAVAVLGVFLVLVFLPGLHFGQSFVRAVAPVANIARVSRVTVTILVPAPADQVVPEGDSVPVAVAVSGGRVEQVILETASERIPMTLRAQNQFAAAMPIGRDPVAYRIRAGDAVTRRYTLTPRPRPHVVRFNKTYRPPTYTQQPARTVTEENGDLDGLEGTQVELDLEIDQPVRDAALRIEAGPARSEVALQPDRPGHLRATLPLAASGVYRVHLVAAQTAFVNKYSPQYEIRAQPDRIPSVKIEKPDQGQLVLPPDAVVDLSGVAKDDLALVSVTQMFRVNNDPWQTFPLATNRATEAKVTRTWDLFDAGLHPGDNLLTKLVATDSKGQTGESTTLRIVIATPGFDPRRLQNIRAQQQIQDGLGQFREAIDQLQHRIDDAGAAAGADQLPRAQALLTAISAAETASQQADTTLQRIQDALRNTRSTRESADLVLVGSAVSRTRHEAVDRARANLQRAAENDDAARGNLQRAAALLKDGAPLAHAAEDVHRQFLAADEAGAVTRDLSQIAAEQRALSSQAPQPDRLARRQSVAVSETKLVEELMTELTPHLPPNATAPVRATGKSLAASRADLETALAQPQLEKLTPASAALEKTVGEAINTVRPIERQLAQQADKARAALQQQVGQTADAVANLAAAKPEADQWQATTDVLKDRAALEERRRDADAQFVNDTSQAARALEALRDATSTNTPAPATQESLKQIERAYRKLEAAHAIANLLPALHQLAGQERWEKPPGTTAGARASDWNWSQQHLEAVPAQLERAQLPAEAAHAIANTVTSAPAKQVSSEMAQRQSNPTAPRDVSEPLDQLAHDVAQVQPQLQPALDEARAELQKAAPALAARLAGLSQATEQLKQATKTKAEEAGQAANPDQTRAAARSLAEDQQKLDRRIDDVRDALRRDANRQDLATDEGRARARDADDALAMLRQPPPKAEELLQQAAQSPQPGQQKNALQSAAEQQGKLADALGQLAQHYQNLDAGQPEPTRTALRQAEDQLGLKPTLDTEYAKAELLRNLAQGSPESTVAELERALDGNEPMRRELSAIANQALAGAQADLQHAAAQEQNIATNLGKLAQNPLANQARQIADQAQRMAQQDVPTIARQATPAGAAAKPALDQAAQALQSVAQQMPQDFTKPPATLADAVAKQAAALQEAAGDLKTATDQLAPAVAAAQQAAKDAAQHLEQAKANQTSPDDQAAAAAIANAATAQQSAQAAAKQAQTARDQAGQAAAQAGELAHEAGHLADALHQTQAQMEAAAAAQPGVAAHVAEAGGDIERAGRHEGRLGQPALGEQLQQLGHQVENQTAPQVSQAREAMAQSQTPGQAQAVAAEAAAAVQSPLQQLAGAMAAPAGTPVPPTGREPSPLAGAPEEAARWMARALDSLDAAAHPAAAQALQAAAQAQAAEMAAARASGLVPGEQPLSTAAGNGGGAAVVAAGLTARALPEVAGLVARDWGKLPPKLARDLMEAQREGVAGEYRDMVDLYFRAIAEKARGTQP